MAQPHLTPEAFKLWLENQPVNKYFVQCDNQLCPLAYYLKDRTGKVVIVNAQNYYFLSQAMNEIIGSQHELPDWAKRFIEVWDLKFGSHNAVVALDALDEALIGRP